MCVTHEMGFARRVADRIIFMDQGEIIDNVSKDEFFNGEPSDRAKDFLKNIFQFD